MFLVCGPLVADKALLDFAARQVGAGEHERPGGRGGAGERPDVGGLGALLKAELKRRNVAYRDLSVRLEAMEFHEIERNLNNKISRGGFSAVFLIQCLAAAGCQTVRISED